MIVKFLPPCILFINQSDLDFQRYLIQFMLKVINFWLARSAIMHILRIFTLKFKYTPFVALSFKSLHIACCRPQLYIIILIIIVVVKLTGRDTDPCQEIFMRKVRSSKSQLLHFYICIRLTLILQGLTVCKHRLTIRSYYFIEKKKLCYAWS